MKNELFDVLVELRDAGISILLVDQMAGLALSVADRGYILESGRVVHEGTTTEIRENPALEKAYLGGFGQSSPPSRQSRPSALPTSSAQLRR